MKENAYLLNSSLHSTECMNYPGQTACSEGDFSLFPPVSYVLQNYTVGNTCAYTACANSMSEVVQNVNQMHFKQSKL